MGSSTAKAYRLAFPSDTKLVTSTDSRTRTNSAPLEVLGGTNAM